jgi:hypothetical protein
MRKIVKGFTPYLEAAIVVRVTSVKNNSLRPVIVVLENFGQQPFDPNSSDGVGISIFETREKFFDDAEVIVDVGDLFCHVRRIRLGTDEKLVDSRT